MTINDNSLNLATYLYDNILDTAFSIKYALINRLNRLRVDCDTRLLARERQAVKYLCHLAHVMLESNTNEKIHVFVDSQFSLQRCRSTLDSLFAGLFISRRYCNI